MSADEVPFVPLPIDRSEVRYLHGPDSSLRSGVPAGTTTSFVHDDSAAYPGSSRTVRVHVPARVDSTEPAALVLFQDGSDFLDHDDEMRAAVVLDNLVHAGDIPATIGVFVDAGAAAGDAEAPRRHRQRNREYDAADGRYVGFLLDEVLPEVARHCSLTDDPARRCLVGFSSGGNAAFTAAWHRPDVFGGVIAFSASFAQMPGGNPYPELVAATPRKPVRVLLQVGHRDLGWDEPDGNWLAANLRVAAALAEAGYDARLVLGDGAHDGNHGGVVLPDALRWVFRQG